MKRDIICSICNSFIGSEGLDICPVCGGNLCGQTSEDSNEEEEV